MLLEVGGVLHKTMVEDVKQQEYLLIKYCYLEILKL